MSNSYVNVEESNKKNELNILLNSPIIPKKIQEIIQIVFYVMNFKILMNAQIFIIQMKKGV
jgi:hypothetical protein